MHMEKPLNYHCHMGARWIIPVMCLHAMYVAALVGFARAVHHVEFRFHELKDLWRGILVSISAIGTIICFNSSFNIHAWLFSWYICLFPFFFPSFMFYNLTEIKGSKSFSTWTMLEMLVSWDILKIFPSLAFFSCFGHLIGNSLKCWLLCKYILFKKFFIL